MGTEARGASNAKAKKELGWELRYPSWREGFVSAYAPAGATGQVTRLSMSSAAMRPSDQTGRAS